MTFSHIITDIRLRLGSKLVVSAGIRIVASVLVPSNDSPILMAQSLFLWDLELMALSRLEASNSFRKKYSSSL